MSTLTGIVVLIAVAGCLYTLAVLSAKHRGIDGVNMMIFTAAFVCDAGATYLMHTISTAGSAHAAIHTSIGFVAIGYAAILELIALCAFFFPMTAVSAGNAFKKLSFPFLGIWFFAVYLGIVSGASRNAFSVHHSSFPGTHADHPVSNGK